MIKKYKIKKYINIKMPSFVSEITEDVLTKATNYHYDTFKSKTVYLIISLLINEVQIQTHFYANLFK